MKEILFIILANCGPTVLEGFNKNMAEIDTLVINRSKVVCEESYGSCVSSITKKDETTYWVLCK